MLTKSTFETVSEIRYPLCATIKVYLYYIKKRVWTKWLEPR